MENRRRLLMAANALLYFGPLLAGLAGFGWGLVGVFTAIFVLWLLILQPYEFPINRAEWGSPDAWVAIAARAAVQLLLVVILFGVGRGVGGVLGAMTGYSPMLPLAISFLSIPMARIIWDPRAQPEALPADKTVLPPPRASVAPTSASVSNAPPVPDQSKADPT